MNVKKNYYVRKSYPDETIFNKKCTKCHQVKLLDEFYVGKPGRKGVSSACIECSRKSWGSRCKQCTNKSGLSRKEILERAAAAKIESDAKRKSINDIRKAIAQNRQYIRCIASERYQSLVGYWESNKESTKQLANERRRNRRKADRFLKVGVCDEQGYRDYLNNKAKIRWAEKGYDSEETSRRRNQWKNVKRIMQGKASGRRIPRGALNSLYSSQDGRCVLCNNGLHDDYHIDHIYPLSKGGPNELWNLQLLCPSCNMSKSDNV